MVKRLKEWLGLFDYKINEHYRPLPEEQNKYFLPVEILKGPFKGARFSFENVAWNRLVTESHVRMMPTYNLVGLDIRSMRLITKKSFYFVAQDIIMDYSAYMIDNHNKLRQEVLEDETEVYPDEEFRADDNGEFVVPRKIRKEGAPVSPRRLRTTQKRPSAASGNQGAVHKVQPPTHQESD